jgi:hypothetical protein
MAFLKTYDRPVFAPLYCVHELSFASERLAEQGNERILHTQVFARQPLLFRSNWIASTVPGRSIRSCCAS